MPATPLRQQVQGQAVSEVRRMDREAERMIIFGPDLGMPHTRAMGKGLFELRMKSTEGIGRVLFCTLSGCRIVMLHAFIKKSAKTPAKELKTTRGRLKEVKTHEDP